MLDDEFERVERALNAPPAVGSRWRHYNGGHYTVIHLANVGSTDNYPVAVVYQGENGKVWTRPADDWRRSMTEIEGC